MLRGWRSWEQVQATSFHPQLGKRELGDFAEMTSQRVYLFRSWLLHDAHGLVPDDNTVACRRVAEREEPAPSSLLGTSSRKSSVLKRSCAVKTSLLQSLSSDGTHWQRGILKKIFNSFVRYPIKSQRLNVRGCQTDKTAMLNVSTKKKKSEANYFPCLLCIMKRHRNKSETRQTKWHFIKGQFCSSKAQDQ